MERRNFILGMILGILLISAASAMTVTLISPTDNSWQTYTNNTAPFTFNVTNSNTSAATCKLTVDGLAASSNLSAPNNTASVVFYANFTLTEGNHVWNVTCNTTNGSHAGGFNGMATTRTVRLDRSAPSSITINWPTAEQEITTKNLSVSVTAIDLYNGTFDCYMSSDGHVVNASQRVANNTATNLGWAAGLTEGTHGVTVTCTDLLSNSLTSSIRIFKVKVSEGSGRAVGICSGGAEWNPIEKRCCNIGEYFDLGSYRCRVRATGQVQQPQTTQPTYYRAPAAAAVPINIGGFQTTQDDLLLFGLIGVILVGGYFKLVK